MHIAVIFREKVAHESLLDILHCQVPKNITALVGDFDTFT
jgi:hypothetical protein